MFDARRVRQLGRSSGCVAQRQNEGTPTMMIEDNATRSAVVDALLNPRWRNLSGRAPTYGGEVIADDERAG